MRIFAMAAFCAFAAAALGAPAAFAHGGDEEEVTQLSIQPARILAQQALAELVVNDNTEEAALQLDAALESEDQTDIDPARLRRATETLDGGDPQAAVLLLDQALSRPFGSEGGRALHEAGREFEPAKETQEIAGIAVGFALLLLGGALLWRGRRKG